MQTDRSEGGRETKALQRFGLGKAAQKQRCSVLVREAAQKRVEAAP